ncbi:hypothetical protein CNBG_5892 [Cryptococcus deuterogattii R265]|uniref:uncharacterized protein n=1 Tax=Cryptococcus deuterogattii (strain R265) TaxID=294750 RepID=UPI0019357545|nr:hypothetical protein CNBG_5892 [Cryptococcus deuterogattii R265]
MPSITLLPFLNTVPPATRALTALYLLTTLTVLLLAFLAPPADWPWLLLVPGHSWKYPWVLLTAAFAELSVVNAVVSAIALPLACRYLERVWGARELVRFCCVTIVGSNIIAFGFSWIVWFVLGSEDALYGLPYHGMTGLQVGFLVAFTQLIPEHQVQLLGKVKLRVKSLPGIHLLISNILVILLGPSPFILIQFGFFVAWVYLRFFKPSPDGGLYRGDRSETFAFQYWFPPVVRPYISVVANHVYTLATRVHLVQAWDESANEYSLLPGPGGLTSASGSNSGLGAGVGVVGGAGGGARAEAERRRALALKALDARLASTPSPAPTAPTAPAAPTLAAAAAPDPATPTLLAAAAAETTGTENGSPTKDTPAAADVESTAVPGIPSTSPSKPKPKPSSTTAPTQVAQPTQPTQPTQTAPAQTQATQAQTQGQGKGQGKKGKGKGKDKKPSSPVQAEDKAEKVDKEEKEEKKKEE